MNSHIKVVDQLSKVVKRSKQNQQREPMYVAREIRRNILRYVDFSKICYVIKSFPELKKSNWKIRYNSSSLLNTKSDWMAKWKYSRIIIICGSNWYKPVRWIHNKKENSKDPLIFILDNDMRDTFKEIYRKYYKQLKNVFISLCL